MKKSILSLSAAVALGGLGFVSSANAWVISEDAGSYADKLFLHNAGTGHQLFTPYYTANAGLATLVNIVNTDPSNGKAVKVRFRGASNSDDVLDFTLFLSPADVWTGAVLQGEDGKATLTTNDKSCTIPTAEYWAGGVPFITTRLPAVADDVKAALTREGYLEVLNMADIAPNSELFTATKHKNGVAPCLGDTPLTGSTSYAALRNRLLSTDNASAGTDGLTYPTGGLMGSWSILDLGNMGTYSGTQTAIVATEDSQVPTSGTVNAAPANIVFFPQTGEAGGPDDVSGTAYWTADPLLTSASYTPLWFDLPDMSTPLLWTNTGNTTDPGFQAALLSTALGKTNVMNEYVATAAGAAVPFQTDWVVSQPTRRYHAAVAYGSAGTGSAITYGPASYSGYADGSDWDEDISRALPNPYTDRLTVQSTSYGPQACLNLSFSSTDREEYAVTASSNGGFSPGTPPTVLKYCGEVFVAQFGGTSALQAVITNRKVTPAADAGWATLATAGTRGAAFSLPIVGYAATLFTNSSTGSKYGLTFVHRWQAANNPS